MRLLPRKLRSIYSVVPVSAAVGLHDISLSGRPEISMAGRARSHPNGGFVDYNIGSFFWRFNRGVLSRFALAIEHPIFPSLNVNVGLLTRRLHFRTLPRKFLARPAIHVDYPRGALAKDDLSCAVSYLSCSIHRRVTGRPRDLPEHLSVRLQRLLRHEAETLV